MSFTLIRPFQRAATAITQPGAVIVPRRQFLDFVITVTFQWFQQGAHMRAVEFTFSRDPPPIAVVQLLILTNYAATEVPAIPLTITAVSPVSSDTFRLEFPPGIMPGAFVRLQFTPIGAESGPFGFSEITEATP